MEEVKIFENGELRDISNATWTNQVAKYFMYLSFEVKQNFEKVDDYLAEKYPNGVQVEELSNYLRDNFDELLEEFDMYDPEENKVYDDREEDYMENVYYSRR